MTENSHSEKGIFQSWISDPFFGIGFAILLAVVFARASSADHPIVILCRIGTVASYVLLAVSLQRANFFRRIHHKRQRLFCSLGLQLLLPVIIFAGIIYGPWTRSPKLAVDRITPTSLDQGRKESANVTLLNRSYDAIGGFEWDYRMKLVPFDSATARAQDYEALQKRQAKEIFSELDDSKLLVPDPPQTQINPWQYIVITPRTTDALTDGQERAYGDGKLTIFLGVRIIYSDQDGCRYQTEICGFFSRAGTLMSSCHSHYLEGQKLACKP